MYQFEYHMKRLDKRLDFITETVTEIKVQTTKTHCMVESLREKEKQTDQALQEVKEEIKILQEERSVEKGKLKIINLIIGGAGAVIFAIIEYLFSLLKLVK